jgi:NitT/TauT family transport system permease protein
MSAVAAARVDLTGRGARLGLGLAGILVVGAAWQGVAAATGNPLVLPAPTGVVTALAQLLTDPQTRTDLLDTVRRVVAGFVAGSLGGLLVGAGIGSFRVVRELLNPYLNFLRTVAPIAWIVPATIWLGVGEPSILFVVVYAAVFPVAINTISGIAAADADKLRMARAVGLSPLGTFARILVPSAVPFVMVGARLGLGLSFMAVVGAEMIIGQSGLGYVIYDARTFSNTALMFAGILVLGLVGYLFDLMFVGLRRSLFRKYYAGRDAE